MQFEWDPDKARGNLAKHGVSFQEAATLFADTLSWTFPDQQHADLEERWITIGLSEKGRVLVLAHTIFDGGRRVRMISAREATRKERSFYEER
jgi:uncharacterized DUF497 family protein